MFKTLTNIKEELLEKIDDFNADILCASQKDAFKNDPYWKTCADDVVLSAYEEGFLDAVNVIRNIIKQLNN